jgi:methionine sulfoxide reductase heme-binding subunit
VLLQLADPATDAANAGHDEALMDVAALSARIAYAMMCLTLTWGALTSMGWVNRFTGRQALRSGHLMLAALTLAFAAVHIATFVMLRVEPFSLEDVLLPFNSGGKFRHTMGILAFEGMLVASIAIGLRRWLSYWRWLWLHRLAYLAFVFGVGHSLLGAAARGDLEVLWLGGITLAVPAATVAFVRFMPAKALSTTGLLEEVP